MKSIIRWAGSKRSLLPELRRYWNNSYQRYIEPFAGSACLFFDLQPRAALLADLNFELVTTYRAVQSDAERVLEGFRRLRRGERFYYKIRRISPRTLCDFSLAARFLYLNRYCFNGLYRTNEKGVFNVPYGPPTKPLTRFEDDVRAAQKLLRLAEILQGDFEATLDLVEKGDFIFMDPPYATSQRRAFKEYLPGSFSTSDLPRLERQLEEVNRRGATFLLSYADTQISRRIAKRWFSRRVHARRNIAGFAGARKSVTELLISNYPM